MRGCLVFVLSVFCCLGSFAGQYHVCTDADGKKSFQAMPCNGADRSEVKKYKVADNAPDAAGWSFYEKSDALTSETICLIRSGKSIKSLPHKSFAGVQLTVIVTNRSPVVGLYSSPTFSETPESFMYDYYPLLRVGGLAPVEAVDMKSNAVVFSVADSRRVISELLSKRTPEIMYRAKFFPYENIYDFNVKYGGFDSAFSRLMACEGLDRADY